MSRNRLTSAQQKALQIAMNDGGELIIGGLDGRLVRRDVRDRLLDMGFLRYNPGRPGLGSTFDVTEAGKDALDGQRPAASPGRAGGKEGRS